MTKPSITCAIDRAKEHPPVLDFEYFKAWPIDGWNLWMEFEGREGIQVSRAIFMGLLAKFWKDNF